MNSHNYASSAKLPISVPIDFDEFVVCDCRILVITIQNNINYKLRNRIDNKPGYSAILEKIFQLSFQTILQLLL
ncbi:MAG: hypothetical protein GY936_10850 [Ignavibacteriae bacterium]|nr:hypothetical protein [Ignavibacteriota bacterium]